MEARQEVRLKEAVRQPKKQQRDTFTKHLSRAIVDVSGRDVQTQSAQCADK